MLVFFFRNGLLNLQKVDYLLSSCHGGHLGFVDGMLPQRQCFESVYVGCQCKADGMHLLQTRFENCSLK